MAAAGVRPAREEGRFESEGGGARDRVMRCGQRTGVYGFDAPVRIGIRTCTYGPPRLHIPFGPWERDAGTGASFAEVQI